MSGDDLIARREEMVRDQIAARGVRDPAVLAAMRRVTERPLDLYVEAPDDLGGFVRSYDVPEIVRVAAPVHLKFGLRNARSVYPSGGHLEDVAVAQAREKVRRAALAERLLHDLAPELT